MPLISIIFFLKFVVYLVISEVKLYFQCYKPEVVGFIQLNDFKYTGMVYCNHSSLIILINDVKYIHKINQILFISPEILAKTFASNIIIDLSYNLSKYMQFEVFENYLKWVVYINTLFSPCIAWVGMESSSNFSVS